MTDPAPIPPLFSLAGRTALVTGAARGLGREIARAFAAAGARTLINGRSAGPLRDAAADLHRQGLEAIPLPFDIADPTATARAFERIQAGFGGLDILVNNVGNRMRRPLREIAPEDFAALMQVNLTAAYALARHAAALMLPRGRGRILMISSIAATHAAPADSAYAASKGGMDALTRALACELGPHGITCNAIAPGPFATETNAAAVQSSRASAIIGRMPLRRWGEPREIAGPALFLASDAASFVNGQVLAVDGGLTVAM
ncbi:MAG: SDR family oxidoreductase [Gammaproteobacteria bacterium]